MNDHTSGPLETLCLDLAESPERVVARSADGEHSAIGFLALVRAWAVAFKQSPGASYALYMEDSYQFAAALLGGWQAGKTLWLPGDVLPSTLANLAKRVHGLAGELPPTRDLPRLTVASVRQSVSPEFELATLDADRCQLQLFTSGSSGEPVAVAKRLRQLQNEVTSLQQQFGDEVADTYVAGTVSHQHIYGLLFRVLWPLASGRVFAARRLEYPEEIAALGDCAVTLIASPAHLKRLPDALDWRACAKSMRACFSSGGPLPVGAAQSVLRLWQRAPIEVYGSTETGGIGWRQYGPGCAAWQPLPSVEWQVEAGALQVRSTHLPDEHWYQTEDRAVAAGAGGFELLGRADRIYKLEERRISLTAIEQRLLASDHLTEAKVLVLPGARSLIAVVAVASAQGQALLDAEGKRPLVLLLREWLRGVVDPIANPRRWRFVDSLPADAQGKSSQARLAALFRPIRPEPRWLERENHSAQLELTVAPDLAHFEGHFPGTPVLPGVAMLDWAMHYGAEAFALQPHCLQMDVLKFQQIVRPGAELSLTLQWNAERGVMSFSFISGEQRHASGRFRMSHPSESAE